MTSLLEEDGKQTKQGKKGANNDDNHHVRGGYDGGTDSDIATVDGGTL
jgi:hypothetical protein